MSVSSTHKRRSTDIRDDEDDWPLATRRQRLSPLSSNTATATHAIPDPTFTSSYFSSAGMAGAGLTSSSSSSTHTAPILPRMTIFPVSPPTAYQPHEHFAFLPPILPTIPPCQPSILSSFLSPAPVPASSAAVHPLHRFIPSLPSRSASSDIICIEDEDVEMDVSLSRAIAASMAEATRTAAVSRSASSAPPTTPPSPSNSVVCLDVDEDDCQLIDPFSSSSSSSSHSPLSSVVHLPMSPSRWSRLPVDLLALISTFQFGSHRSMSERHHDDNSTSRYGGHANWPRNQVPPPHIRRVMQVAMRSAAPLPNAADMVGRPDAALLSVRLLLIMSTVCRHWQTAVKPPARHQYQQAHTLGCRVVDCWSGVQQLEIKQSGKHVSIGGLPMKRRHVATVLASMSRLRSLYLEFNVDPSALEDTDFTHLLPGFTMASFYPQLQQLTIRLVWTYVPPRSHQQHQSRRHHQQQQSPQHQLYTKLSAWLDCHPKLRSFVLIDPHANVPAGVGAAPLMGMGGPMPLIFPPFQPAAHVVQGVAGAVVNHMAAINQLALLQPPAAFPPIAMPLGPLGPFPLARLPQPAYRPPAVPQPSAGALRLLCTGRLQHMALAGETLVRLAYGEEEEREGKEESEARQCYQAEAVQSIDLIGDYQQPRYMDALYEALPSLTHLTFSRLQSSTGAAQLLAKVGQRVTYLRGSTSSLISLSLPATVTSCSALQSLCIHMRHAPVALAHLYPALPSLPSLTQLSVVEQRQPGGQYPVMHNLPELSLPPLPQLLYLHLQLSSHRAFPLVANRNGAPSSILPAKLTHLLLSIPGQQLVPHLSSVPVLCPKLTHCHISSGASVTSQTWETRLGRLKAKLRGVWCERESEVIRHRMDMAWRAEVGVRSGACEEWEAESW